MTPQELSKTTYGLIGRPLGNSKSKAFFTALFAENHSRESYDNFELQALTPEALYSLVLINPCLRGFNVTAPYKEEIMPYLDSVDTNAAHVGAVNTVKIERDSTGRVTALRGFNTDVEGFRESVRPMVEKAAAKGALVLGTGGASKAVVEALTQLGVDVIRVSRSKNSDRIITYGGISADLVKTHPLIINATPIGTFPAVGNCPPFPYELLDESNLCHDLVYNPAETEFMKRCSARGAEVKNGLEMLHRQALASLELWRRK